MKTKSGVSLIELVIVVIILILVTGFAVFTGQDSAEKAKLTELLSEATNIKKAVNGVIAQMELEGKENDETWLSNFYNEKDGDWYEIYGMDKEYDSDKSKTVRKNLDMDTIKRSYKVKFSTGDVKLSEPIKILGTTVETYDEIRDCALSEKI